MTVTAARPRARDLLEDAVTRLAAAGVPTPRVDAEWLLSAALGIDRGRLGLELDGVPPAPAVARYDVWVRRRAERVPLQHLLGTQAFRDVTVRVNADVLVPRPETELVVSWALELVPGPGARVPLVLDVGTGSGCIACAIAVERPDVRVVGLELSPAAAGVARDNVAALGLTGRVTVLTGDLFSAADPTRADLIVSNPPYLPTDVVDTLEPEITRHEPRAAIDGGRDGLDVVRRLVPEASRRLRPGAWLLLETAGGGQADAVAALLEASGLAEITARRDLTGTTRFVAGRRRAEET